MKTYTVLMLYPDYVDDEGATYLDCVQADSVEEAQHIAQQNAALANEEDCPLDFAILYVAEGWHPDVKKDQV